MKCFSHLRLQAGLESRSSKCPQASSSVIFCEWNPSLPPEPMVSEHTTSARPGQNIIPKKCNMEAQRINKKGSMASLNPGIKEAGLKFAGEPRLCELSNLW